MEELVILVNNKPLTDVIFKTYREPLNDEEPIEYEEYEAVESFKCNENKKPLLFSTITKGGFNYQLKKSASEIEEDIKLLGFKVKVVPYEKMLIEQIYNNITSLKGPKPIEKVERLLYSKKSFDKIIDKLTFEIEELKQEEKDITKPQGSTAELLIDDEQKSYIYSNHALANKISTLEQQRAILRSDYRRINDSINSIKEDEYYPIIDEIYENNKTYEEISEFYGWKKSTIAKHRRRLLNILAKEMYTIEYIRKEN